MTVTVTVKTDGWLTFSFYITGDAVTRVCSPMIKEVPLYVVKVA